VHVTDSVVVARPVDEVFELVADLRRTPEWQTSLERLEVDGEGVAVGTHGTEVRRGGGRKLESRFEVTALDPGRRLAIETRSSSVEADVEFAFADVEGGTRVQFELELRLRGALRFMEPVIRSQVERQSHDDLERLKALLEGSTSGAES
jgi:uncharacterized membrane protein